MTNNIDVENPFNLKYRLILRENQDGTIQLLEDLNANYIVLQNKVVIGIYENRIDAVHCYGRLTRKE